MAFMTLLERFPVHLCALPLLLLLAVGCGDDAVEAVCIPGSTQTCAGQGACDGDRRCNLEGSDWGDCICATPDDGGVDAGARDAGADAGASPNLDQFLAPSDRAILEASYGDGGTLSGIDRVDSVMRDCARNECIDELVDREHGPIDACMSNCLDTSAVSGLSVGCRGCFIDEVDCGYSNCVVPCITGNGSECMACLDLLCAPRRAACIGDLDAGVDAS